MANKKIGFGLLAIVLTFGVILGGCEFEASGSVKVGGGDPGGDNPNTPPSKGLYVGIIGFNENITPKEISLLNTGTKSGFTNFISGLTTKSSTGLYYAVDKAIDRLAAAKLPDDLSSVALVTFTDGLDNASIALNTQYSTRDAYRDAVKNRISTVQIKGKPIEAYSIGIKGGDVSDDASFNAGLQAMASSSSNVHLATSMTDVNNTFRQIADSLYKESQSLSIDLKMSGGYDNGTKIRFTFDDVRDANSSSRYIEGTFTKNGNARSLENVQYVGLNSTSGTTVSGTISETVYVKFKFAELSPSSGSGTLSVTGIQQWEYVPSMSLWQRNSEFDGSGNVNTTTETKSAVIMLVLDCTSSLDVGGANGFSQMKSAATTFIGVLVDGSNTPAPTDPTTPSGTLGSETNPINLINGSWTDGSITSTAANTALWYYLDATSGTTYYFQWNDGYEGGTSDSSLEPSGDGTKTLDVKVELYGAGTTPVFSKDDGWSSPVSVDCTGSGRFKIKVYPYTSSRTGTFAIRYSTTRPTFASGTQQNPILLTNAVWTDGTITTSTAGSAVWYYINVTSTSSTHSLWWNDSYEGNNTKTLDILVDWYAPSGTRILTEGDDGWSSRTYTTFSTTGKSKIKVYPYDDPSNRTGTFGIVYRSGSSTTRPSL